MDPQALKSWLDALVPLGALAVGAWAIHTYRQAKEAEAARWQKQVYDDLFLSGKFDSIKRALEFDYDQGLGRFIELSVQERDEQLDPEARKLLLELDNFLNLVEYVLYLEKEKRQISEEDRAALLDYWTSLIAKPERSVIRYYASHYGYEKVAELMGASGDTFLVLYGSLRRGQPMFHELGLDRALEFLGPCEFSGQLYDLGEYPGAVAGPGKIAGEIYKVRDQAIFAALDEYEEFDVSKPDESLFVRRCIHIKGFGDAWVYLYNGKDKSRPRVASGDWLNRQTAA